MIIQVDGLKSFPLILYNLIFYLKDNREENNKAPLTYKQFQRVISGMKPPSKPVSALTLQILGTAFTPLQDDHDENIGCLHWRNLALTVKT